LKKYIGSSSRKKEPTKVQKEAKEENEILLDLKQKEVESTPNLEVILPIRP